jgi:predicted ATP-dependent Lon-type protease
MKTLIAAAAVTLAASAALAEEPVQLSDTQMDQVTAGGTVNVDINITGNLAQGFNSGPTNVLIQIDDVILSPRPAVLIVIDHPEP